MSSNDNLYPNVIKLFGDSRVSFFVDAYVDILIARKGYKEQVRDKLKKECYTLLNCILNQMPSDGSLSLLLEILNNHFDFKLDLDLLV